MQQINCKKEGYIFMIAEVKKDEKNRKDKTT